MAEIPPPTLTLNPFASPIDLTTAGGQKTFTRATAGSSEKFSLTNDPTNAENFKQLIDEACKRYCWGPAIDDIPVEWDMNGNVTRTVNIMKDFRSITLAELVIATGQRFDCEFADNVHDFRIVNTADPAENLARFRSVLVGEWILNSLSDDGRKTLRNNAKYFEYKNTDGSIVNDGATILLLVLQKIMPSTKVGVTTKKSKLMAMDPSKHNQDVGLMIVAMETLKTRIEAETGKDYDDFLLHLFTACCKSTNSSFCRFATDLKSDWETDKPGSPSTESEVINLLNAKWNNECVGAQKDAPDPKDPKYLALFTALTTSVQALSQKVQTIQRSNGGSGSEKSKYGSGTGNFTHHDIAEWRKKNNLGDEVTKDGKHHYWCDKHLDGNGLYVTHHPLDHGKHPRDWEHTKRNGKSSSGGSGNDSSHKLQLNETMKAALTSNGLSAEKAESLLTSLQQENGLDFW